MQQFMGFDTVMWTGVVEDRKDPLELGRVRVRIAGVHSKTLVPDYTAGEGIPVNALPWAYPALPITSAGMNGIGETPVGPVEGTWVGGISRDGRTFQNLIYLYVLPGIPQNPPVNEGFNDTEDTIKAKDRPHEVGKPGEKYPKADFIKEPDVNRLARNKNIDKTIVKKKKDTEDKGVVAALGSTWDEPTTKYATQYPFNKVFESESGHINEIDDTPGAERTHGYHRTGTFVEVHPDGSRVTKIIGDDYEIIEKNGFLHVKGNLSVTVEGSTEIYSKGNTTVKSPSVVVDAPHIELGKGATEHVVLGDTFKALFNEHTHIGNLGVPTSAPNQQMGVPHLSAENTFSK